MRDGNFGGQAIDEQEVFQFAVLFQWSVAVSVFAMAAQAQTYSVIHAFTGGRDGAYPFTGLTLEGQNLFGTTFGGADHLRYRVPAEAGGNGWFLNTLAYLRKWAGRCRSEQSVDVGPDGALYGVTSAGGGGPCFTSNGYRGCGTVYKLLPPRTHRPIPTRVEPDRPV